MRSWAIGLLVAVSLLAVSGSSWAGDREVAEEIAGKLRNTRQLRGYDIRVKFERGTAWLRGRVVDHHQKTAALTAAFQTEGVEKVVDNLIVRAQPQGPQHGRAVKPYVPPQPVHSRAAAAPQFAARPLPPVSPVPALPLPEQLRPNGTSTRYLGRPGVPMAPKPVEKVATRNEPSVPMAPKPAERVAVRNEPSVPVPSSIPVARQMIPDWDRGDVGMASTDSTENARLKIAMLSGQKPGVTVKPASPEVRPMPPVKPVRRPIPGKVTPATAQKASYTVSPGQGHATSMHIASTLTDVTQPIPFPSEFGASAGEAIVSDGFIPAAGEAFVSDGFASPAGEAFASDSGEESPGLLSTEFGASAMQSLGTMSLHQSVPQPIRGSIVGQPVEFATPPLRSTDAPEG